MDLRDLDAFVAVARSRNFRRAAVEQRVSVSSLSQRLRALEERLGVHLMNRTTRSVGLTEAGEFLLARVGPAMSDVGDALKADRVVKVSPPGKLIASHQGLARRATLDGVGFWPTFEGYVREDVRPCALVSVLDDWCTPFPGPFLYYPSRRQTPPALGAFIAFVAEWRKREL
jgi:DNA-binding transcriptional LysR family regulator